ncbi:MAG: 1-acyl-sn-glycerol-3-phosphate acyltransferase [Bacteroidota bacterium]
MLRVFFREIAVEGAEHVPRDRGGLLVAWHPNGLIDPALIITHFPGRIVFGARDGLLRWPLVGWMMRRLGTVPIYRAADQASMSAEARREANARSLDALADGLGGGSFSALFPEGQSHDQPFVTEVKSGAARLFLRALDRAEAASPVPVVLPVGLHYDRKHLFRSDVLVTFHPPLALPPDLGEMDDEVAADFLTERVRDALVEVVRATDDWTLHRLMHRGSALVRAEDAARAGERAERGDIVERSLGFARMWHGYRLRRASHAAEIAALRRDLTRYDRLLRTLGLDDADLDAPPPHRLVWDSLTLLARTAVVYVLLPPLLLFGLLVNGPVHGLIGVAARRYSGAIKDTATVKILVGFVLYPLAWIGAGVLAALAHAGLRAAFPGLPDVPLLTGLLVTLLAFAAGVLVLKYVGWEALTRQRLRAYAARQRRRDLVAELRALRADLHDRFLALGEGLDLPGDVTDTEGRIAG